MAHVPDGNTGSETGKNAMRLPTVTSGAQGTAVLAFDVGGTHIKSGLFDASGTLRTFRRISTPLDRAKPAEAVLETVAALAREVAAEVPDVRVDAAGIVVPGIVDPAAGTAVYSANLGWRNYPFAREAERQLGMPVSFGHDVSAAGDAELALGAAKGFRNAMVVVAGTGIAAAVFCEGIRVTAGGYAGEIGQALVPAASGDAPAVLESIASAAAIARRYAAQSGHPVPGAKEVLSRARAGDPIAARVWAEAVDALAFSLAQCTNLIGTEAFIIGGGLSEAGDALLVPLRDRVDKWLTADRQPRILPAALGQDAGLIGAALNARELLLHRVPS